MNYLLASVQCLAFATIVALSAAPMRASVASKPHSKPNIIVILADDLGYGELGCYGGKDAPTPNLDAMAKAGARFTSGYVTSPVCSPTRAGLLTGKYQHRFGHENNIAQSWEIEHAELMGLPVEEKTIADRLKNAGYRTACIGKWHLGVHENFHPQRRGFDEFFGFLEGGRAYLSDDHPGNFYFKSSPPFAPVHFKESGKSPLLRGQQVVAEEEYLTDAFTREALRFMDASAEQPFFLYLAYNAVHTPITPCPRWDARLAHIENPVRRAIASMMAAMDENIGKLRDHLRERGMAENTLIIFLSDNGGSPGGNHTLLDPNCANYSLNTPLRGFKGECWEGGIRVPYLIEWPAKIKGGVTFNEPVSSMDIVPTALAAAETQGAEQTDGVDLIPFLSQENNGVPHEELFWRYHTYKAVRKGSMKLVRQRNEPDQLFDLASDIGESKNLAAEKSEVLAQLQADLGVWESKMNAPRWSTTRPLRSDGRPLFGSLLANGNMEEAQPGGQWPASWYRSAGCVKWSAAESAGGGHALCIEDDPQGRRQLGQWRSQAVKASPGSSYTLKWSWHYNKAQDVAAHIRFFDMEGNFIGQKTVTAVGSNQGFEQRTHVAVAPSNASTVDVVFMRAVNGAGSVWIDDVVFSDELSQ
jgi:arylsulfatase A-like enzyme